MLRKYNDAANDCKRAIELDPDNIKAYMRASKCSIHLGNLQDATALLRQAKAHVKGNFHLQDNATSLDRDVSSMILDLSNS